MNGSNLMISKVSFAVWNLSNSHPQEILVYHVLTTMCLHMDRNANVACNCKCLNESEWLLKVTGSHVHCTRSSAITDKACDAVCRLKSCQLLNRCTKNSISKGLLYSWITLKITGGHRNCWYSIGHRPISLPISDLSLSCTGSEISPLLQFMWLPVTLISLQFP